MPIITLPDGSQRSFDHPVSVAEVAQSIGAGLANETPAWSLNQLCGSGLRAVAIAAQQIALGDARIVVAGDGVGGGGSLVGTDGGLRV